MKSKPPADRRKFAGEWDEIGYLYDKLLYWLYKRADREKARTFAKRLEQLLPKVSRAHDGIFGEECWSLLYEAKGNLAKAIEHRENEIRLIRRLHEISRDAEHEHLVHKQYSYDDLSDRLDLLAVLYHDSGNLEKALSTLWESKRLCDKHGIKFDGDEMLQEYLEEKRSFPQGTDGRIGAGLVSSQRKSLI
jgi:tetratricopeptide (TPR) repeat protein